MLIFVVACCCLLCELLVAVKCWCRGLFVLFGVKRVLPLFVCCCLLSLLLFGVGWVLFVVDRYLLLIGVRWCLLFGDACCCLLFLLL